MQIHFPLPITSLPSGTYREISCLNIPYLHLLFSLPVQSYAFFISISPFPIEYKWGGTVLPLLSLSFLTKRVIEVHRTGPRSIRLRPWSYIRMYVVEQNGAEFLSPYKLCVLKSLLNSPLSQWICNVAPKNAMRQNCVFSLIFCTVIFVYFKIKNKPDIYYAWYNENKEVKARGFNLE